MSQLLIDKIKKSRETNIEAGGFKFTVRRPTDMEVIDFRGQDIKQGDILERFVLCWNVTETDIIPGGSGIPVPFQTDLFMEWVADRPDLWAPLIGAIMVAYDAHQKKMTVDLGEPEAG